MSTPEPPPFPGDSTPESGGLPSYGSVPPPPDPPGGSGGSVPPPPPPPAPPSYGGPQAFSAPDAIGWGWLKFKENAGPVILAVLVILAVTIGIGFIGGLFTGGMQAATFNPENPMSANPMAVAAMSPLQLVLQIGQTVVSIVLGGVAARAALDVTEGKPFDFFGAFGRVNVLQLILASLVVTIGIFIGFVLCVIPAFIVMFLTYLSTYSIVDDGKSAFDGIKHSVQLISSNVGGALLMALLNFLVVIAGFLALCVGLIVAIPVTMFATAYTYRYFNGQTVAV